MQEDLAYTDLMAWATTIEYTSRALIILLSADIEMFMSSYGFTEDQQRRFMTNLTRYVIPILPPNVSATWRLFTNWRRLVSFYIPLVRKQSFQGDMEICTELMGDFLYAVFVSHKEQHGIDWIYRSFTNQIIPSKKKRSLFECTPEVKAFINRRYSIEING